MAPATSLIFITTLDVKAERAESAGRIAGFDRTGQRRRLIF
jgi:hypothetical protein